MKGTADVYSTLSKCLAVPPCEPSYHGCESLRFNELTRMFDAKKFTWDSAFLDKSDQESLGSPCLVAIETITEADAPR